jgi:hypothetical protein
LLDVDGFLSPYGMGDPPDGFTEYHRFFGEEPVPVNPAHGAWITDAGRVLDITWAIG